MIYLPGTAFLNTFLGGWENAVKASSAAATRWNFSRASGVVGVAAQVGVEMSALRGTPQ